jgi:hypothetical protein
MRMTVAAKQSASPEVAKLHARRHKWADPVNVHYDTTPSGCNETERACEHCGIAKITVHPPFGFAYRAFRSKGGIRFPDPGYTPVCDGEGE